MRFLYNNIASDCVFKFYFLRSLKPPNIDKSQKQGVGHLNKNYAWRFNEKLLNSFQVVIIGDLN